MKITSVLVVATLGILGLSSWGISNSNNELAPANDSVKTGSTPPVTVTPVSPSPEFPNANIEVAAIGDKNGKDSTKVTFNFTLKNYELKLQTADNGSKNCNNSDKGQHIHFILDNQPYKALYEPKNEVVLPNDGKEHYLMAFLSRSYHESIKSKGAAVVYHFMVDKKGNLKKLANPKTPMVFYSRPKGDYLGKDTTNILLDYYVWNCSLSNKGYKVKAEISNLNTPSQSITTTMNKWEPSFIKNLGTGKCKVTLTLVDKNGKSAQGPMTNTSREFNLKAQ